MSVLAFPVDTRTDMPYLDSYTLRERCITNEYGTVSHRHDWSTQMVALTYLE